MKKLYTNFLMSLLGLFMAVSASAQADFTGRSVQSPAEDYSTQPIVFSLSEVAAKLNTNAADLVSALDTWAENYDHEAEEQEGNMLETSSPRLNESSFSFLMRLFFITAFSLLRRTSMYFLTKFEICPLASYTTILYIFSDPDTVF